jgi:hypothetical protein
MVLIFSRRLFSMPHGMPQSRSGCKSGPKVRPQKLQHDCHGYQRFTNYRKFCSASLPVLDWRQVTLRGPPQREMLVAMLGNRRLESCRVHPVQDVSPSATCSEWAQSGFQVFAGCRRVSFAFSSNIEAGSTASKFSRQSSAALARHRPLVGAPLSQPQASIGTRAGRKWRRRG